MENTFPRPGEGVFFNPGIFYLLKVRDVSASGSGRNGSVVFDEFSNMAIEPLGFSQVL
jgi:hypothetical protein